MASVSAGVAHTVALKNDGSVWAWGLNTNGQLGNGATTQSAAPVQVTGFTGAIAVSAGATHSVALKNDGTVWAWGLNSNGQLGNGTITQRTVPVQVTGLTGVVAVSANAAYTLALKSDGTIWAWGLNSSGQLGDGTFTQRTAPVRVTGLTGVVAVSAGNLHAVALLADGTVRTWGNAGSGQFWLGPVLKKAALRLVPDASDLNQNAVADAWEQAQFGNTTTAVTLDPDLDGLSHIQEAELGSNPASANSDADLFSDLVDPAPQVAGTEPLPVFTQGPGNNQSALPGAFLAQPLETVVTLAGQPMANTPVMVRLTAGAARLALRPEPIATNGHALIARTDAQGRARVFVQLTDTAPSAVTFAGLPQPIVFQATTITTPPAPTGVTAAPGNAQVELAWPAVAGATSYKVQRSTTSGTGYADFAGNTTTNPTFTDTGLTNGTAYFYVVFAVNAGGSSPASAQATATPVAPPTAPTGVTAAPGNAQVTLTWTAVAGATSYKVQRSTISGAGYADFAGNTTITPTFTDTGLTNGTPYYYVVFAVNAGGTSPASTQATATPVAPPAAPTGVTAAPGNAQVTLNWPAVTGATSYKVQRSITSGTGYADFAGNTTATPTLTDIGLTNGTAYYYVVFAVNAGGTSPASAQVAATPVAPPAAPTGVTAAPGNARVTLTWPAVTGAASYKIQRSTTNGSGYADFAGNTTTNPTFTNTGLTNGTAYYYVVFAVNAGGASPASAQATATPVAPPTAAPTSLTATPGNARVSLTWSAVPGVTGYTVRRSTVSGSGYVDLPTTTTPSLADTGLVNGTKYFYVVAATNAGGPGPNSTEISATPVAPPAAPTGVTATPGNARVTLSWPAVTGATSYKVQRSTTNGSAYTDFAGNTVTALTLTNTGLTNGTTYYYVVFALNAGGSSAPSAQAAATPVAPPSAPTGVTAAPGNAQVMLNWPAVAGATSYKVQRSTTSGTGYADFAGNTPATPPFTNTGLTNGTAYYYVVFALNAGGSSARSAQATATPIAPPTVAPSSLTAVPGNARVTLNWNAVPGATGYVVRRSITSGSGYVDLPGITTTSLLDTGLVNGTTYFYVVVATNAGGLGPVSTEISATPVAPPAAPTGLSATPGDGQIALSWNAVPGAAFYRVRRSITNGGGYADFSGNTVTGLTFTNTGLTNGTPYYYVVVASNAGGESLPSAQAGATPIAPPAAPTGLSAVPGNAQVSLSWNAVPGVTGYVVRRSTVSGGGYADFPGNTTAETTLVNTGLTNGTPYYYKVAATNAGGVGLFSTEAAATPVTPLLPPPNPVRAVALNGGAALHWDAVPGATAYKIRRSVAGNDVEFTSTEPAYMDQPLGNETTYSYTVRTVNEFGPGPDSAPVTVTPRVVLVFQDTNADGVDDAWAVQHFGTVNFATSGDADSDGLTNSAEYGAGTNPNNSDSDGDGFDDGEETEDGSDPKDPNSKPLRPPQNIRVEANYETYTITITWDPPANTSDQVVVEWALLPYSRHWRKWEAPVPEGSSIRVGLFGWPFIASPYVYRLRMMRGNRLSRPSAPVWNEPIKAYLEATSWYETDSFDLGSSPGVNFKGQQNFHGSPAPVDESWSTVGSVGDIIKEDVITFRYQWISDTKFAVLNEGSETYVFQRIKADDPPVDLLLHVSTVLSREGLGYGPVAMYLSGDWSDKPWRRWTEQKCVIYVPKVSLKIYNRKGKEIWDDYALIQANNNNDEGRPASNGVEPRDNDDDKADPSKDPDLVKVVLEGPTQTQTGKVQVVLPSGIRAFTESGELIESPDLEIDLANPTGQLAGLKQGPLTIYLEAQNNAQGGQFSIAQYASDFGTGKIHLLQKEYVNLLPVEVTVRKKGTAAAPDDGLLVKTGDVLEFALAPHFFDTEDNFESLINWQQRRLKSDGTYTEWLNIGAHAKGTKFEHTTAAGGIFQIKAVITNGGEYEYKRKKDAPHGSDSGGTVNPIYKKDELDYVGVCDAQWQMEVRCAAKSHLGSLAYGKSVDMPVYAGGPSTVDMPKCNIFVYHACTAGGVAVPLTTLSDGTQWPPTAKRWWSQNVAIAGWNNLLQTNEPQPGYVVSRPGAHVTIAGRDFIAAGHVGILDYDGAWINAGSKTVNKFPHLTPPRGEYQPARMREKK
jgi:fibronectin type 3 domain-containing protein